MRLNYLLENFYEDLNTPKEHVLHIKNIFWRLLLFPLMIWWFLLQLISFSFFLGMALIVLVVASILISLGTKESLEDLDLILLPILAPFIWLYRYFVLGEFCTLFD